MNRSMNLNKRQKRFELNNTTKYKLSSIIENLGVLIIVLVLFIPIFWIVLTSFKPIQEVFTTSIFFQPTLENYTAVFSASFNLGKYYTNSIIVVSVTLLITLVVSILASYSLSRFPIPGKQLIMFAILATQFIPLIINAIPYFIMFRNWGLLDTTLGLIVVNMSHTIPYAIWLIKGFIDRIPVDIEEQASIDGASRLRIIWHILLPLAKPGIITASVFCFVIIWNEFMFALILTNREAVTLPIALQFFIGEEGVIWNQMAAAGVLFVLPTVIFMLLVRKQFVQGMTSGSIK